MLERLIDFIIDSPRYTKIFLLALGVFAAAPAVMFALSTPFSFIDDITTFLDYQNWSLSWLKGYLLNQFIVAPPYSIERFRPMFEIQNSLQWFLWGENALMHHLVRLVFQVITVGFFVGSLHLIQKQLRKDAPILSWTTLLMGLLYIFYPNQPAARLAPQEGFGSMFLAVATFFFLKLLFAQKPLRLQKRTYCLFLTFAFCCLMSKEPYLFIISPMVGALLFISFRCKRSLGLFALGPLACLLPLYVYMVGYLKSAHHGMGVAKRINDAGSPIEQFSNIVTILGAKVDKYLDYLFLSSTHGFLQVPFILLTAAALGFSFHQRRKRPFLGLVLLTFAVQFGIGFAVIAYFSESSSIRYAHPLFFVLALMVGTGLAFLENAKVLKFWGGKVLRAATLPVMVGFTVFFIAVNYYNYILQYSIQWRIGSMERDVRDHMLHRISMNDAIAVPRGRGEVILSARRYLSLIAPYYRGLTPPKTALEMGLIFFGHDLKNEDKDAYYYQPPRSNEKLAEHWCYMQTLAQPALAIEDRAKELSLALQNKHGAQYPRFFLDGGVQYGPWEDGWKVYRYCGKGNLVLRERTVSDNI